MKEKIAKDIETKILKTQNITTLLFILTLIVSIYLTYNEIRRINDQEQLTSLKFDEIANLINRIIGVLILIVILYLSISEYKLSKEKNTNSDIYMKEIIASVLQLIAGIIILLVVVEAQKRDQEIGSLENPIT